MGRGVSYPTNATKVCYVPLDYGEDESCEVDSFLIWEDFIDNVRCLVKKHYPSFDDCSKWIDREEQAILENGHAYIVVAEYCGLASVSLLDRRHYDGTYAYEQAEANAAAAWCRQVADKWGERINKAFNGLQKIATASNGESFYLRT